MVAGHHRHSQAVLGQAVDGPARGRAWRVGESDEPQQLEVVEVVEVIGAVGAVDARFRVAAVLDPVAGDAAAGHGEHPQPALSDVGGRPMGRPCPGIVQPATSEQDLRCTFDGENETPLGPDDSGRVPARRLERQVRHASAG